jgi:hypothetical protein
MNRLLGKILALFFPWAVFLLEEKFLLAVLALALQVTVVGWLPMTILAFTHLDDIPLFQKKRSKKAAEE